MYILHLLLSIKIKTEHSSQNDKSHYLSNSYFKRIAHIVVKSINKYNKKFP